MGVDWWGIAAGLTVVAAWGLAPAFISRAVLTCGRRFSSLGFNGWRNLLTLPVLAPVAVVLGFPRGVPLDSPWFHFYVAAGSLAGSVLGDVLLTYSIAVSGASRAVPVAYLYVVWSALLDYLTEPGSGKTAVLAASLLAAVGVWVAYGGGASVRKGLLAALGSSVAWTAGLYGFDAAASMVRGGALVSAASIALVRAFYASIVLLPYTVRWRECVARVADDLAAATLIGYVLGYFALSAAVTLLPLGVSAVTLAGVPVAALLASRLLAHEWVKARTVVGAALVALAIALSAGWTG